MNIKIADYTLEIVEDDTYCPISHEFEPIIRFRLFSPNGELEENESINLDCLHLCQENLADKVWDKRWLWEQREEDAKRKRDNPLIQRRADFAFIRYLYYSFMYQYNKGLLYHVLLA